MPKHRNSGPGFRNRSGRPKVLARNIDEINTTNCIFPTISEHTFPPVATIITTQCTGSAGMFDSAVNSLACASTCPLGGGTVAEVARRLRVPSPVSRASRLSRTNHRSANRRGRVGLRSQVVAATVLLWCCAAAHAEQYFIPLFVAPGAAGDPQGVLTLVNEASEDGSVQIVSIDDSGTRTGPAILTLGASAAVQLSATELKSGNPAKGLPSGLGDLEGEFRLVIDSDVPIIPSAYVRGVDGVLAAMNTTVLGATATGQANGSERDLGWQDAHRYDVTLFHPVGSAEPTSRLRLINPGETAARVTIEARDDAGNPALGESVALTMPAGGAQTLTAQQLEVGDSTALDGGQGASLGNWRLTVSADRPIHVLNVTVDAAGAWRNLSSTAVTGWAPESAAAFESRFIERALFLREDVSGVLARVLPERRVRMSIASPGLEVDVEGSYTYERIGRDAGRVVIRLDANDAIAGEFHYNLYFNSPGAGWHANELIDPEDPDGDWIWPGSGIWLSMDPAATPLDLGTSHPDDRTYGVGKAIEILTLPAASGGQGGLTYSLAPEVPGLRFDPETRQLAGTPSEPGTWVMAYRVRDGTGDTDRRYFKIAVHDPADASRETTFGAGSTLTDLPTGDWTPDAVSGASFTLSGGIVTVELDEGGYIEEGDHRYTCQGSDGCTIENRRVSSGTVVQTSKGTAPGAGSTGGGTDSSDDHGDDRGAATAVAVGSDTPGRLTAEDVDYFRVEVGASGTLEAYTTGATDTYGQLEDSGGSVLSTNDDGGTGSNFRLSHDVSAGTYFVRVRGFSSDETGSYTLHMRFVESDSDTSAGAGGDCYVGLTLNPGGSCTYPGTTDVFTVTDDGRGRFLFFTSGGSIDLQSTTVNGRTYDFAASHQGDGVWRIERVEGSTEPPDGSDAPDDSGTATGQVPDNPPNAVVTQEGTYYRIKWDATPRATHYEVWRCSRDEGFLGCQFGVLFNRSEWTNLARNLEETTYLDTDPPTRGPVFNIEIFYLVQACNRSGCSGPF